MPKTQSRAWTKHIFTIIVLVVIAAGALYIYKKRDNSQPTLPPSEVTYSGPQKPTPTSLVKPTNQTLPKSLKITVPFTPQAPTANWDELHNEACEEASTIMAHAYFSNITSLPPATVETEITKLTKWQDDNYGYHLSINTQETARMLEEVYDLNAEIVDLSEQTIKQALFDNKLVIMPVNGQLLGNPNFRQPGPIYHMFIVTGYNGDTFITNEPGTRKGHDYQYSYQTLLDATGNYDHDAHAVNLDDKKIIIVSN